MVVETYLRSDFRFTVTGTYYYDDCSNVSGGVQDSIPMTVMSVRDVRSSIVVEVTGGLGPSRVKEKNRWLLEGCLRSFSFNPVQGRRDRWSG